MSYRQAVIAVCTYWQRPTALRYLKKKNKIKNNKKLK